MTEAPEPVLSAAETQAAEALLGERILGAELIWNRENVVRLRVSPDRSVVLKRGGGNEHVRGFGPELAALAYLTAMPAPVAPRLLGSDAGAGILLMEDLGPGRSLAGSLLAGDRRQAQADLVTYARALGSLHAWSTERPSELASLWTRYAPGVPRSTLWLERVASRKDAFLGSAAGLGLATAGAVGEIDELGPMMERIGPLGLVHGDACPDNTRLEVGGCRIFDFETAAWGPVVIDAVYLLAPFPTCWCFAALPDGAAAPALAAYRDCLAAAGLDLGPDWDAAQAAAVIGWIVNRGDAITRLLDTDPRWGTTTMRPRLLAWLRSFTALAARSGALPRLYTLASALVAQLEERWPDTVVPQYPALADPGTPHAHPPDDWPPDL